MDTAAAAASRRLQNKKGRVFTRPAGTFPTLKVSASATWVVQSPSELLA